MSKFRLVLSGHWLSLVGTGFFGSFLVWFLNQELSLSYASWTLMLVHFLPALIALPVTLLVIDRVSKFRLVVGADCVRALASIVAGLVAFIAPDMVALVVTLSAVVIIRFADALYGPAVRAGLGSVMREGAKHSSQFYLTLTNLSVGLIMPLLVPVSLALSLAVVWLINGATYLVSGLAFFKAGSSLFPVSEETETRTVRSWFAQLRAGFGVLARVPVLVRVFPVLPFIDFGLAANSMVYPAVSQSQQVVSATVFYGLIVGLASLSRIAGVFVFRYAVQYRADGWCIGLNCVLQGCLVLCGAWFVGSAWFLVMVVGLGLLVGANSLAVNELIQANAPEADLGKCFTYLAFASLLAMPFGPFLVGVLGQLPVHWILVVVAVPLVLVGLIPLSSKQVRSFVQPRP